MNSSGHRRGRVALVAVGLALMCMSSAGCKPRLASRLMPGDSIDLEIKGKKLQVEVASDDLSRKNGLMYRKSLPESQGMIFVYPTPRKLQFWMRNTYIPLSIAFLDDRGKILEIQDMRPKDESHTVSKYSLRYALEVNQGWFQRNGVGVGDTFTDFDSRVRPFHGT